MEDTDLLREILSTAKTVAVVGLGPKPDRPAYGVAEYLQDQGYVIFPVNPGHAGKPILGRMTYASLADIPVGVDLVDIFRNPEAAAEVVDEAIRLKDEKGIRTVWMQVGIRHEEAAARARVAGLDVVMDKCTMTWHRRLLVR
ncbi:MAG: CoA-binding protein [Magnetospirillum sp. WYHS-4]